jgi:Helicase associated domain
MSNTTMARKGSTRYISRVVFLVAISANCFNVHRCQGLLLSATNPSYLDQDAKPFKFSHRTFRVSCTGTSTGVGQDDSDAAFADSVSADLMSSRCEGHLDPTNVPMLSQRTSKPPSSWMDRFQELLEFKTAHGHARVPKRYDGGLGVWVNHQRQRRHRLDEGRIVRLDAIGFCWDAAEDKVAKERQHWWERFRQLQDSPVEPLSPSQAEWLRRQRNEYVDFYRLRYSSSCRLDRSQIGALNELDPSWWKTAREREWDVRCQELLEYRNEHGR